MDLMAKRDLGQIREHKSQITMEVVEDEKEDFRVEAKAEELKGSPDI